MVRRRRIKGYYPFYFYRQDDYAIHPTFQFPKTHFSNIPVFHHSNCERSELSTNFMPAIGVTHFVTVQGFRVQG